MHRDLKWSKTEKKIARQAFDMAYERECEDIINTIKSKAGKLKNPDGIWKLCDMLVERRNDMSRKYDYRYSQLIIVFGVLLLREGWLNLEDLSGLRQEKLDMIVNIGTM